MKDKNTYNSVFSVDVEDGISLAMRDVFKRKISQTDRVVKTTNVIISLLDRFEVKATFFILGQVASQFPDLVKDIADKGHEIGVHGYNHLRFNQISPQKAREELLAAKKKLEDIIGCEVLGHRAPAFSISSKTPWAFDVLVSCGFKYDSSIMPTKLSGTSWANFPENPCKILSKKGKEIIEIPIKPYHFGPLRIPYSGGSYLRLLPFSIVKAGFLQNHASSILYIHPYELDEDRYPDYYFHELNKTSWLTQIKMRSMWLNRKQTKGKLEKLLSSFSFSTMRDFISCLEEENRLEHCIVQHLQA